MNEEVFIRLAFFIVVSLGMAAWETALPRRPRIVSRALRWPANLGILALDSVFVRLIVSVASYSLASRVQEAGVGLLNAYLLSAITS